MTTAHVRWPKLSGNDRQFDLVLPLNMGGEGSVLNAQPAYAVCDPYRFNHRHRRSRRPFDYVI
jgi:hypothetical protein